MNFTLNDLNEQELNLIINSLAQQPYIQVYQLIEKLQKQFQTQVAVQKLAAEKQAD